MPARPRKDAFEPVERYLSRGDWANALAVLLPELDARAEAGDRGADLAARLLRTQHAARGTEDTLAAALDRLVALVERQETQIRALRAMVEEAL